MPMCKLIEFHPSAIFCAKSASEAVFRLNAFPPFPSLGIYMIKKGLKGVYVLYKDWTPVYVGKSDVDIASRLRCHSESNQKDFDFYKYTEVEEESIIPLIEAIIMHVERPELNKKMEPISLQVADAVNEIIEAGEFWALDRTNYDKIDENV